MLQTLIVCLLVIGCLSLTEPEEYKLSFPKEDNHLNISVNLTHPSANYFIVIGDWGASRTDIYWAAKWNRESQLKVAGKLQAYVEEQGKAGKNLLFFVIVGDNFYYEGLDCSSSKNYWDKQWHDIYGDLTTKYYWFSMYGNHDWGNSDKYAMCPWKAPNPYIDPLTNIPYAGNQLTHEKGGCTPKGSKYYMPDYSYYYTINDLNFELIALEENIVKCPSEIYCPIPPYACETYSICGDKDIITGKTTGCRFLGKMRAAGEAMMVNRATNSQNKNFIIAQHYESEGKRLLDNFESKRNINDDDVVVGVYGHVHNQRCDSWIKDKYGNELCQLVLTGGGGGCCGYDEDLYRGFFPMEFDDSHDGNIILRQPMNIRNDIISYVFESTWHWLPDMQQNFTYGNFYGTAFACDGTCKSPNTHLWIQRLKQGDGKRCTSGHKVYCNKFSSPYVDYKWKGTAPLCHVSCNDCSHALCIASNQAGDGAECHNKRDKYLCARRTKDVSFVNFVYTPDIEMGFIFNSTVPIKTVSSDNNKYFLKSIDQWLRSANLNGTTFEHGSVVNDQLLNETEYYINVKYVFDTVSNANASSIYLDETDTDNISYAIINHLSSLTTDYDGVEIRFVEANIGFEYIYIDEITPITTDIDSTTKHSVFYIVLCVLWWYLLTI
eukprot:244706_1